MNNILYIHGLGGTKDGRVASILRDTLGEDFNIDAPEIPIDPKEAVSFIRNITFGSSYDMIVASSLGAFYSMFAPSHIKKIMINPAIYADEYVDKYIGKGTYYFNGDRENGESTYKIDEDFINSLRELRHNVYLDDETLIQIKCYVSDEDELLIDNWKNCDNFFFNGTVTHIKG